MHAQAVVRGSTRALVVVDMPFGSYEESPSISFRNAARAEGDGVAAPSRSRAARTWRRRSAISPTAASR